MRRNVVSLCACVAAVTFGSMASQQSLAIENAQPEPSIVEIAVDNDAFSTLVAALQAADLVEALQGEGPFTVFAPTNDAFAALPEGTVENLLKPENKEQLIAVLTYHVVPGRVAASEAVAAATAGTLVGQSLSFGIIDGRLRVNESNIIKNDIGASNGVIHVIDQVLLPPVMPETQPPANLLVGINWEHVDSETRARLGLGNDAGIEVTGVNAGLGAADAGLQRGDIIVSINGAAATIDRLRAAKKEAGAGGTIEMEVVRSYKVEVRPDH